MRSSSHERTRATWMPRHGAQPLKPSSLHRPCATSAATACRAKAPARRSAVVTVIALFALWWVATHAGWIRDLFLPTPETHHHQLRATHGRATSRAASRCPSTSGWSLFRVFAAFALACVTAIPVGHRDGRLAHRARHLRSADRVLPSAAAARVPAADRDLVRHRGDGEDRADLPRVLRAARDGGARRRARA